MLANPTQRVINATILIGAEVRDIDGGGQLGNDGQHRVDTVVDIQIRLPLFAIAKDVDLMRIGKQLVVKVEDVSVSVAFAEYRDKTKDIRLELETGAISGNQTFAR